MLNCHFYHTQILSRLQKFIKWRPVNKNNFLFLGSDQKLYADAVERCGVLSWKLHNAQGTYILELQYYIHNYRYPTHGRSVEVIKERRWIQVRWNVKMWASMQTCGDWAFSPKSWPDSLLQASTDYFNIGASAAILQVLDSHTI